MTFSSTYTNTLSDQADTQQEANDRVCELHWAFTHILNIINNPYLKKQFPKISQGLANNVES